MAISARRRFVRTRLDQQASITELVAESVQQPSSSTVTASSTSTARRHPTRPHLRIMRASKAPFATISTSRFSLGTREDQEDEDGSRPQKLKRRPVFMIASAAGDSSLLEGVPAWRKLVTNLAAGATAGCAVEAALYPIDTIKTRLQVATHGGGIRALFQSGGGKALYSGLVGNLVGVAPSTAVFMATYEPMKQWVEARVPQDRQFLGPLAAGAASGLVASIIRVPTEVVKQRMQSGEFKSAMMAVRNISTKEGFRGLYAGYGSFLLRDLPFDAIEFVSYEQLRRAYRASLAGNRDINAAETAAIGAVAGAVTGVLTTPFDVLKTRLMTQGASGRYKHVGDCAAKILQEEGWRAFFRGWEPRVLWISLGGCVFFSALEQAKKFYAPRVKAT